MVRWQVIIIIVVCVLAAAGLFLSISAPAVQVQPEVSTTEPVEQPPEDAPDPYTIDVFMFAGGIGPAEITVPKGQKLTLNLQSSDGRDHRFLMQSFRIDESVIAGQTVTVVLQPETVGQFPYQDTEAYDGKAPGQGILTVE